MVIVAKTEKSGRWKVIFTQNQLHKNVGMVFIDIPQELTAKNGCTESQIPSIVSSNYFQLNTQDNLSR